MKLKISIAFTDKYTNKKYAIGDEIEVESARGKELLADSRKLVELLEDDVETIEEVVGTTEIVEETTEEVVQPKTKKTKK